jgi:hypothetical protein
MMNKSHLSVRVVFLLMVLNALLWLAFGLIIAVDAHPALPLQPRIKSMMAFLSFAAAGVLPVLLYFLSKRNQISYYLTFVFFIVVSLLIILDEVGWVDLAVLAINIIPLVLLYKDRTWYLAAKSPLN